MKALFFKLRVAQLIWDWEDSVFGGRLFAFEVHGSQSLLLWVCLLLRGLFNNKVVILSNIS